MDIRTDRTGYDCNSNESDLMKVRERLRAEGPLLLVGSSLCV